jgi:hypothetical protein
VTNETLLLIMIIVLLVGAFPAWPYSKPWGYAPTGFLTMLLVLFLVWAVGEGRPLFRNSGTIHDTGQDLKSAGRDVADSIRRAAQ